MRRVLIATFTVCMSLLNGMLLKADPIPVRYPQGTTHGFLVVRTMDGKTIAAGDLVQQVHGDKISSRLTFHFHDGSLDDDLAVFTQNRVFHLVSEHHIQKGPSFPKPLDMSLDTASGTVVEREVKQGSPDKVTTRHMDLPDDLANGYILTLLSNIKPSAQKTVLSLLVNFEGTRIIHLEITPDGFYHFRVGGEDRRAHQFAIKVKIGGLAGVIAPMLGKQPPDLHFILLEGGAPAFVREEGVFFEDGPVWRIEQVGPITK